MRLGYVIATPTSLLCRRRQFAQLSLCCVLVAMSDDDVWEFHGDQHVDPRTQLSDATIREWLADTSDIVDSRPRYNVCTTVLSLCVVEIANFKLTVSCV